ncbi:MAG: alpha-amylase, partial [Robiginitalea sp.]
KHTRLSKTPYVFSRTYSSDTYRDKIVVGLNLPQGKKSLRVKGFFGDGTVLYDTYSETQVVVKNGKVELDTPFDTVLLEIAS